MAELLLLGMTHYPPLAAVDDDMAALMRMMLADPGIPAAVKDPATWAPEARAEWGDDEARSAAAAHRAVLCDGFTRLRAELDAFAPDALVVWGDDDRVVPRECGERYAREIAGARLEVVADSGHAVDVDQPARLAALMREHSAG